MTLQVSNALNDLAVHFSYKVEKVAWNIVLVYYCLTLIVECLSPLKMPAVLVTVPLFL